MVGNFRQHGFLISGVPCPGGENMTCSAAAAQASDKDHMNKNLNKKTALFHTFHP